jgi:hypothetical protein
MTKSGDPASSFPHQGYFLELLPLAWSREPFERAFYPSPSLAGSYPGLMQWQDHFHYALATRDAATYLLAAYDRYAYLPLPPKPFTRGSLETAFGWLDLVNGPGASGVSRVEGLTEEQAQAAAAWGWPVRRASTEYVYDRERSAGLHGDPYRAKRADVNHLLKHQAALFRPFRPADAETCRRVFDRWQAARASRLSGSTGGHMLAHAASAHERVLRDGASWGLSGAVVEVDGEVMAYTFGSRLSPDTYGVLLEVADLTVKGLSAYIFSRLCASLEGFRFVNGGDAEELPGLAEAKEHWHPVARPAFHAVDRRP